MDEGIVANETTTDDVPSADVRGVVEATTRATHDAADEKTHLSHCHLRPLICKPLVSAGCNY
jgi:hypothetical protein